MPYWLLCRMLDALFFFFIGTATTEIYTLSLHDALPICVQRAAGEDPHHAPGRPGGTGRGHRAGPGRRGDRKSTRLNSSHPSISYAVFCLKKKIIKSEWSSPPIPIADSHFTSILVAVNFP